MAREGMRSEDALRRALSQAIRHEADRVHGSADPERVAFALGARMALQWAVGDTSVDPFGGVGIHEKGDDSFYRPAQKA